MRRSVVAYLAEVEERRLHLDDACSSLFDFCQRRLGLSEGEAFRRMTAARLVRRFPSILGRIERGEIHLSALALLAKHVTHDNHEELLCAASHKSKREVQEFLAARFPKDDVPTTIRLLPETRATVTTLTPTPTRSGFAASASAPALPARPESSSRQPVIEPLSAARYKVQFTAPQELRDKLERATQLMSHRNPSGDLTVVLNEALDLLIARLEKRRQGNSTRPARRRTKSASRDTSPAPRCERSTDVTASNAPSRTRRESAVRQRASSKSTTSILEPEAARALPRISACSDARTSEPVALELLLRDALALLTPHIGMVRQRE